MPRAQPFLVWRRHAGTSRPQLLSFTFLMLVLLITLATTACRSDSTPRREGGGASPPQTALTTAALAGAVQERVTLQPEPSPSLSPPPTATPPPAPTPVPWIAQPGPPPPVRARELAPPALGARAAVVIDGDSGAVLFDLDAHTPLPPASTTKIVTALLAIERGNLDDEIEVKLDDRTYWGSVMGLRDGDRFTLRDLLYGLMLPSGNDAAYVIAMYIAPSEREFAELMNARMRELGLTENHFVNSSGLGRGQANLISARDLAQVARYAMGNPTFAAVVGTRTWTARGSRTIGMRNGNELLYSYPGADGVKIGWGGRTGGNTIVGTAVKRGHRLFVALLDTPDRGRESAALLDWAFASFTWPGEAASSR